MAKSLTGKVCPCYRRLARTSRGQGPGVFAEERRQRRHQLCGFGRQMAKASRERTQSQSVEARAFKGPTRPRQPKSISWLKDVAKHFRPARILVNNAGIVSSGAVRRSRTPIRGARPPGRGSTCMAWSPRSARHQTDGDGGRIVTIGSGIATRGIVSGLADYAATKGAIGWLQQGRGARPRTPRHLP